MDPIAYAIPVFMLLIGVEVFLAKKWGLEVYRFADSIADLSCGVMQQVLKLLIVTFTAAGYIWVHSTFGIWELSSSSVWVWVGAFFGVDFFYYWFHRSSHGVNFLWAAHVVHHQSEEYNLTVALRQSFLQPGFSWVFYLPLAVIGVPPLVFFVTASINTLYQFWIHTRLIDRMGPLEWFLNTPSHHRVHHGQNTQYIDRNHAGILIIWDKMFGTFEPEVEEVVYGITEPSTSWSPLWSNVHSWWVTVKRARQARTFGDKLRLFFGRPGWMPADMPSDKAPRSWPPPKYDPEVAPGLTGYVLVQFALVVIGTTAFLLIPRSEMLALKIAAGASILVALVAQTGMLDGRGWARRLEQVRLPLMVVAVAWSWPETLAGQTAWLAIAGAACGLSWAWLMRVQLPTGAARSDDEDSAPVVA